MVNAFLSDKSKLDVAAIFKAEREFYEAKSQTAKLAKMGSSGVASAGVPSHGKAFGGGGGSVSVGKGAIAPSPVLPSAGASVVDSNGDGSAGAKKNKKKKKKSKSKLVSEVEKIRGDIQATLETTSGAADDFDLDNMPGAMEKLTKMEADIKNLTEQMKKFGAILERLDAKNSGSQQQSGGAQSQVKAGGDASGTGGQKKAESAKPAAAADDDIDLFGSDEEEEDEDAKKLREERLAAYDTKKAKKPALIAKSSIVLEVKPWDDETDVTEMEKAVRTIQMDGLLWGASKFVEIAYGIKKLQISAVVEDDKVSVDLLEENITNFEDLVQSVDIASFNKI